MEFIEHLQWQALFKPLNVLSATILLDIDFYKLLANISKFSALVVAWLIQTVAGMNKTLQSTTHSKNMDHFPPAISIFMFLGLMPHPEDTIINLLPFWIEISCMQKT